MARKIASFTLLACFAGLLGGVSPAAADDAYLVAYMTGAAERPGPGDPDGVGRAVITIDDETNQLCLALQFVNVTLPTTGLHIHVAPTTAPGPIVVRFTNPTTNQVYECVTVADEALLDNIAENPQDYYINLHTLPLYAAGAIRGQLQAA
jgi:hypothetical protein